MLAFLCPVSRSGLMLNIVVRSVDSPGQVMLEMIRQEIHKQPHFG